MEIEATIKDLKTKRKLLKSKVTLYNNHFTGAIKSDNDVSAAYANLTEAYNEFFYCHTEYAELVTSDDQFDSYAIVNGLNLEQYLGSLTDMYDQSTSTYSKYKSQQSLAQANQKAQLALNSARTAIDKLEAIQFPVEHSYNVNPVILYAENALVSCQQSFLSITDYTSDFENLISKLGSLLLEIQCRVPKPNNLANPVSDIFETPSIVSARNANSNQLSQQQGPTRGPIAVQSSHAGLSHSAVNGGVIGAVAGSSGGRAAGNLSHFSIVSVYNNQTRHNTLPLSSTQLGHTNVHSSSSDGHRSSSCSHRKSRFKESPLPTFNGDRLKWAEFKAIWCRYGAEEIDNDVDRAYALKQCLKDEAYRIVESITANQPDAYTNMWHKLDLVYSDVSQGVQHAHYQLEKLKPVKEGDYAALVKLVNAIEVVYSQLGALDQLSSITLPTVDNLADLLPITVKRDWLKAYRVLMVEDKIHPFPEFMRFIESERDTAYRESARKSIKSSSSSGKSFQCDSSSSLLKCSTVLDTSDNSDSESSHIKSDTMYTSNEYQCVIHNDTKVGHVTANCPDFVKLERRVKFDVLKGARVCFRCFGNHSRHSCKVNDKCSLCGFTNHHVLLCKSVQNKASIANQITTSDCNAADSRQKSVFAINHVRSARCPQEATLFYDGGSNTTYILNDAVKRLKARKIRPVTLDVTTMGGNVKQFQTNLYEVDLLTTEKKTYTLEAFGMETLTGPVRRLDMEVIQQLFPLFNVKLLERRNSQVDILVGINHLGAHPKKEVARCGEDLGIFEGKLGFCIQGTHPALCEGTVVSNHIKAIVNVAETRVDTRKKVGDIVLNKVVAPFIEGEQLGLEVLPKCGACKCGKCPTVGHTYSFQEQQELDVIRSNLIYDKEGQRWVTKYPWIEDPSTLPDNYGSALATLRNTEKRLKKDPEWAKIYDSQIQDMIDRNVARKLSKKEMEEWTGPLFYISHLAVENPKSKSTPVRIVFNSSQKFKGFSLNGMLAKGPDAYLNNILGILLRWRENYVGIAADIRKMYNSIFVEEIEQHCHRFLWRNMDDREPDVYVIMRVNMGDKPAGAISAEALYKTASMFRETNPDVAQLLLGSTYVDDIVDSVEDKSTAVKLASDTDTILGKAGFKTKGWLLSGESEVLTDLRMVSNQAPNPSTTKVLGVEWVSASDEITYSMDQQTQLFTEVMVTDRLTRRRALERVMKIYDPLGILSPFTLRAKIYLRETWSEKLGWDEVMSTDLQMKWKLFFDQMENVSSLRYNRCLKPIDASSNDPKLIIFSDGSDVAYGAVAYVRWQLENGKFWSTLVMAKSRIAPMKKISTPQMELNGAVVSKRIRQVIEKEMRVRFEEVIHLVDSVTVLGMLHKISTRFKIYEGVRLGEIQAATNGNMDSWYWIEGKSNIADYLTRPKDLHEINQDSRWWKGPEFLETPMDSWAIKSKVENPESLPGEKASTHAAETKINQDSDLVDYSSFSSPKKLLWTVARVLDICRRRFKGGCKMENIDPQVFQDAKILLLRDVQRNLGEMKQYKQLKPVRNDKDLWVLGGRLSSFNPLAQNPTDGAQVLLPTNHPYTRMLMRQAHVLSGHGGRDSTLARFRWLFWTPQGSKIASAVKRECQMCKKRDVKLIQQHMGNLPTERLSPSPPFNRVMLDIFGPYLVRGEVQKRISQKAYGVIFTDLYSRAVHIEPVYGYDTASFMLALLRFTSIRGWPAKIYSDPGSQLVAAERELSQAWSSMDKAEIHRTSTENGTTWTLSPADSPWRQGAVEALIKSTKRCFSFSMCNHRLSPSEFNTVCYQVSNTLNERPIGRCGGHDSDISVLTPNLLLLGRTGTSNPGNLYETNSYRSSLVSSVYNVFWKRWCELYAPTIIRQYKWFESSPNLRPDDIVVVCDQNALKSNHYLARVKEVFPSCDGKVRKVSLAYKNFRVGEKVHQYCGAKDTIIYRSVQKLALLAPAPEWSMR